jgi:hypothetical protein
VEGSLPSFTSGLVTLLVTPPENGRKGKILRFTAKDLGGGREVTENSENIPSRALRLLREALVDTLDLLATIGPQWPSGPPISY